jgi:hypothetical protein
MVETRCISVSWNQGQVKLFSSICKTLSVMSLKILLEVHGESKSDGMKKII